MIKAIVRLEGLLVFLFSLGFYHHLSGNWIVFFLLFLLPDLSMVGYLLNKKIGAIFYNSIHNYILALLLIGLGESIHNELLLEWGLILVCHVGLDRFFGFGLKYTTHFRDTHIQKL